MAKQNAANANTKTEKKESNNLISVVIIIMLAILIVGVGGFALYYITNGQKGASSASSNVSISSTEDIAASYDITDEFLVNLADKNQAKYLKTTISLGYDGNSKLAEELKTKESVIRDTIVSVLMTKSSTDFLSQPDKLSTIQDEIKVRVNPQLKKGKVIKVLFRSLTIQ